MNIIDLLNDPQTPPPPPPKRIKTDGAESVNSALPSRVPRAATESGLITNRWAQVLNNGRERAAIARSSGRPSRPSHSPSLSPMESPVLSNPPEQSKERNLIPSIRVNGLQISEQHDELLVAEALIHLRTAPPLPTIQAAHSLGIHNGVQSPQVVVVHDLSLIKPKPLKQFGDHILNWSNDNLEQFNRRECHKLTNGILVDPESDDDQEEEDMRWNDRIADIHRALQKGNRSVDQGAAGSPRASERIAIRNLLG